MNLLVVAGHSVLWFSLNNIHCVCRLVCHLYILKGEPKYVCVYHQVASIFLALSKIF